MSYAIPLVLTQVKKWFSENTDSLAYEFLNHNDYINYLKLDPAIPNKAIYENIRMHYKIFARWMIQNGFTDPQLYLSSFGRRTTSSSSTHTPGKALDITGGKKHANYLFFLYLKACCPNWHISISRWNHHLHIDMVYPVSFDVEINNGKNNTPEDRELSFTPWSLKHHEYLRQWYDFGAASDLMYKFIDSGGYGYQAKKYVQDNWPWWLILIPIGIIYSLFKGKK